MSDTGRFTDITFQDYKTRFEYKKKAALKAA
jgi:hypothetical protein